MVSNNSEEYTYSFDYGINYFKGANSTGKTEFYHFIDYMFGSSEHVDEKLWFRDTLKEAIIEIDYNDFHFQFKRSLDPDVNYYRTIDEDWSDQINAVEYKDRLNALFSPEQSLLKNLRDFTEEDLTYRTFTMFNFLGEKSLGNIIDFLDKGRTLKYSIKLQSILNYIFNNNLENILMLRNELYRLQQETELLSQSIQRSEFVINKVNVNLNKLGINKGYNGKNKDDILAEIKRIKTFSEPSKTGKKTKTLTELETIFNNISEQIKIYENRISDSKSFQIENTNRLQYLKTLEKITEDKKGFEYLIEPIRDLVNGLNKNISFNSYIINNNTIKELKKQKELVKNEMINIDNKYICFTANEKTKYVSFIEELLSIDLSIDIDELELKRKRISELREQIRALQNTDDVTKINALSEYITELYTSTKELSDVVNSDVLRDGFSIQYYKKGNMLQPKIIIPDEDEKGTQENYYTGSMARHTLIQLCGYLAFLRMLIQEKRYPLIPIFVIDHISKPFDMNNRNAIGGILKKIFSDIKTSELQIFMFDDESFEDMSIQPSHEENLVNENKTGFNPFYHEKKVIADKEEEEKNEVDSDL